MNKGISSYSINENKSPTTHDRYTYRTSSQPKIVPDNFTDDYDYRNYDLFNTPGTPGTPKANKIPAISTLALDAPNAKTDPPVKLIDINAKNEVVIAIGQSVYIWKDKQSSVLMEGTIPIDGVCWADNHVAISGAGHVELWDVQQQEAIRDFYDHQWRAGALSSNGTNLATGGADGIVCLFDLRTNRNNRKIQAHHGQVLSLSYSPGGSSLASGSDDCNVCIFNSKQLVIPHKSPVQALAWMNSSIVVTGDNSHNGTLQSFNIRSNATRQTITGGPISSICMTEKWGLFVSHNDKTGRWDIWSHDLSKKLTEYRSHQDQIINMTSNSDGSFAATISTDESLILWELTEAVGTPNQLKSPMSIPTYSYSMNPTTSCLKNSPAFYRSKSPTFNGLR